MDYDTFRAAFLDTGRWHEGEAASRDVLARDGGDATALLQLGVVLAHLDRKAEARDAVARAIAIGDASPRARWWLGRLLDEAGDFTGAVARREIDRAAARTREAGDIDRDDRGRFLLIRSWGAGFWSEILHLMGGLLTAEITRRTPVVAWGANCLFRDADRADAFPDFFEPVSDACLADLPVANGGFFPPKWGPDNLARPEVGKTAGPWSRMSSAQFIGRPETVAVYDHFNSTHLIGRWIPAGHPWHGLSTEALNRRILAKYLRPRREFGERAMGHITRLFGGEPFDAVHLRGTDKALEMPLLDAVNAHAIARLHEPPVHGGPVFLLTDSTALLDRARAAAGPGLRHLDCLRGGAATGVHFERSASPRKLGGEVLVDVLVARCARSFLGNGWSSVSCGVRSLSMADAGRVQLTGPFDMALDHYGEYFV
jgi:protein O-GlcNAc transferase